MTIMATMRGIPQLYYGSEIGMAGDKGKGDADIRQDFPGGWKGDTNNAFSASGRTAEQVNYFDFSKKILNWRKNKEVIHTGKLTHYIPENNVYVYFRHNDKETVMVLINNAPDTQKLNLTRFQENIKSFTLGNDILSGKTIDLKTELSIEGKTSMILELK